jgi:hypothetical protein
MKFYITKETKQEIETKIQELKKERFYGSGLNSDYRIGQQKVYTEILENSIIIPVEESWDNAIDTHDVENAFNNYYPNGVIIQPKQ